MISYVEQHDGKEKLVFARSGMNASFPQQSTTTAAAGAATATRQRPAEHGSQQDTDYGH
uniref:hypothetical protein n=1 Tax=Arthrobacter sp. 31.31 TaxID=347202 RepID=UPI001565B390|nr:hypothetical protein [Arthrobacter sp. 31.31]